MTRRAVPLLDEVEEAVHDVEDVLIVVAAVLNAAAGALSAPERDALATVVRLGRERAASAGRTLNVIQTRPT